MLIKEISVMMESMKGTLIFLVVVELALSIQGANILAVFPTPSKSHIICYQSLTRELAARGHHLTVISSYPQEKSIANYTDIAVPINRFGMDEIDMFDTKFVDMLKMFISVTTDSCEYYLGHPEVQKLIHDKEKHFDLILMGLFFNECQFGFAQKYKVPVIGVSSNGGAHFMLDALGNTSPYAYIPNPIQGYNHHMNFKERLISTIGIVLMNLIRDLIIMPRQDAIMRKYFIDYEPIPYITEVEKQTSMMFLNTHVSISDPRPYLPNTIEVGGMHIKPAKKLPLDLQKYLDEAKDGVIYFSLGSNLKASQMSESKREAFISAFSKVKQRILWKSDMETIPGLSDNVKLGTWLPQGDILAHPNVLVFITHGGLLSTQESVYNGMPVIGIPIFADQLSNMNRAQLSGYGLTLEYKNVTKESVHWAMETVLINPSYKENAKRLSAMFRDQPRTPLQQAVYWTEYVLRNGASHMRSAALDLAWYQYFLLDVIAFICFVIFLSLLVLYLILKVTVKITRKLCTGTCSTKTQSTKAKKNK